MKKLMFFLLLATSSIVFAKETSYAWNTSLITTNKENGTGSYLWTSPEPIDSNGFSYYFTSRIHAIAYALRTTATEDAGIHEFSAEITRPSSLPLIVSEDIISGEISGTIIVTYSFKIKSFIDPDWKVKVELSDFTTTMPGGARLEITGDLAKDNGFFVQIIPEPTTGFWIFNFMLFILYKIK